MTYTDYVGKENPMTKRYQELFVLLVNLHETLTYYLSIEEPSLAKETQELIDEVAGKLRLEEVLDAES